MAVPEDLVGLILASLEPISTPDLSVLSFALADESSLQLQRLWFLLGSPSQSLSIISFLEHLSLRQRRLLLARVTLGLMRRITGFLQDLSESKKITSQALNVRSISAAGAAGNPTLAGLHASGFTFSIASNGDREMHAAGAGQGSCTHESSNANGHRGATVLGSEIDGSERIYHSAVQVQTSGDGCRGELKKKKGMECFQACVEDRVGNQFDQFEEDNMVRQVAACSRSPGRTLVLPDRAGNIETSNLENMVGQRGGTPEDPTLRNRPFHSEEYPNKTGINGLENVNNSRRPWGDADAAFLLLFLSETQEQECQEAMRKWSIDPYAYRRLIVRDMGALGKGGLVRAPKWREKLQQYLLQNILQVGYGVPGMITSANFPASLSAYINTIGRFQRLLRSVDGHQQKYTPPPASAATLLSLPTISISSCKYEKGKLCSVCGDELEVTAVASQLPCSHMYHWDCIFPWLKQRNTCPVCRHELPTDDPDYELERQKQFLSDRLP